MTKHTVTIDGTTINFVTQNYEPNEVQIGSFSIRADQRKDFLDIINGEVSLLDDVLSKKVTNDLSMFPLRRPARYTKEREAYLRANASVSAASLAMSLGVTERFVIQMQRKLGLRPMARNNSRYDKSCA